MVISGGEKITHSLQSVTKTRHTQNQSYSIGIIGEAQGTWAVNRNTSYTNSKISKH